MSILFKKPRWATGASAEVTEPSEGKKDLGWTGIEKPPHNFFNWLSELTYNWIDNLSKTSGIYSDLSNFIANAEENDRGYIVSDASSFRPFEIHATPAAYAIPNIATMDGDGEYIYTGSVFGVGHVAAAERWTKDGVFDRDYLVTSGTAPTSGTNRVCSNGHLVAVLYKNATNYFLAVFNAEDGSQYDSALDLGSHAGNTVEADIAMDDAYVYVAMDSLANVTKYEAEAVTGGAEWTAALNNACALATDGVTLYVGANGAMGGATTGLLASLNCLSGAIQGEAILAGAGVLPHGLACDGRRLLAATDTKVFLLSAQAVYNAGGTLLAHDAIAPDITINVNDNVRGVLMDRDFVGIYGENSAGTDYNFVQIAYKDTLEFINAYATIAVGETCSAAYSDDEFVFWGSPSTSLQRFLISNRHQANTGKWLRSGRGIFSPKRQLAYLVD